MTDLNEAELLERFQAGASNAADAFGELARMHQGPLLRYARGLLGAGSSYEDVVQEALLKLAQSPPKLSAPGETLGPWLFRVARNLCMDVMRSESTRKKREESVAAREATGGGIAAVEARDTRAAVEQKLSGLPVDQRDVLVLRLLGDKSYKEIAAITGKKIGTVGWLVSEGLKALSVELAPLFQGEFPSAGSAGTTRMQGETS